MLFQLPGAQGDTHQVSRPSLLARGQIFFSATHLLEEQAPSRALALCEGLSCLSHLPAQHLPS